MKEHFEEVNGITKPVENKETIEFKRTFRAWTHESKEIIAKLKMSKNEIICKHSLSYYNKVSFNTYKRMFKNFYEMTKILDNIIFDDKFDLENPKWYNILCYWESFIRQQFSYYKSKM